MKKHQLVEGRYSAAHGLGLPVRCLQSPGRGDAGPGDEDGEDGGDP